MTHDALDGASPERLSKMLAPEALPPWPQQDVAAVLRHQLAAALLPDLSSYPGAEAKRLAELLRSLPAVATFADLLAHSKPPRELLEALRLFSRHHREDPASPLRGDAATLLYYAAIAAGLTRRKERLTTLSDAQLREGLAWAAAHPAAREAGLTNLMQTTLGAVQG